MKTRQTSCKKYAYLDYEYTGTTEKILDLVCCETFLSDTKESYSDWLYQDREAKAGHKWFIEDLILQGYTIIAYGVTAEASSFLSLGIEEEMVREAQWFCLFTEYKNLSNHHAGTKFGPQLIDGKVVRLSNSPWAKQSKAEQGLSAAIYKLLKIKIDTERKEFMRDVIISGNSELINQYRKEIQDYCKSDIVHLPALFAAMVGEYKKRLPPSELKLLKGEMLRRGEYNARTACMERDGYPINVEATRNFSDSVKEILTELAKDINDQFPDILPFKYKRADNKMSKVEAPIRAWIDTTEYKDSWAQTEGKKHSLALDAFEKFFNFRHDYPRDNFGAQMVRYLKTKQSLNGFMPKAKKRAYWPGTKVPKQKALKKSKTFWDSVGTDGMVRPYLNIYGAQSARTQPAATGFIPLKSAWMRALIQPPSGYAMGSIDFGQQEFFIAALLSNDPAMIKAYESGDVYLFFGIESGEIPKGSTKSHHLREKFKSTTLGIQFLMTKFGLSRKLTVDTGHEVTEEDAQELIDMFDELYEVFAEFREELLEDYKDKGYLKLPCGWTMWGDNPNDRSASNCPIQGFGSSVMRLAVRLAQQRGINVRYTLHDALYIMFPSSDLQSMRSLAECMDEAFRFYFPDSIKPRASIRLDGDIWSPDYADEISELDIDYDANGKTIKMPVKKQRIYVDGRAKTEYKKFNKYFEDRFFIDLL